MGEIETLFVLLGIVYLVECCVLADKNALVFSPAPFTQQLRKGLALTLRSVLVFLNPIPFFATVNISHPEPVSLSIRGVALYNSLLHDRAHLGAAGENFIAYADIARLDVKGARLRINEREFVCADSVQAAQMAADIERLMTLRKSRLYAGDALDKAVENELRGIFSGRLNLGAARQRRREVARRTLPPAVFATLMLLHLFAIMPVGLLLSTSRLVWLILTLVFLALHFLTAFCFWYSHRKLYPADSEGRLKKMIAVLFNPFASMGCPRQLTRDGLAGFHPMLAGYVLLRGSGRRTFMHRAWSRLAYNTFPNYGDAQARDQLAMHNRLLMAEAARALAEDGAAAEELLLKPPFDPTAHSYCPICLLQYTAEGDECLYCLGVPLHKAEPPRR